MLKTVPLNEVVTYVPIVERGTAKPTKINFRPLSKRTYDEYLDSLTEQKKNKLVPKIGKSGEFLFRKCLTSDQKGVFIYNAFIDGKEISEITDKEEAIRFLLGLADVETANEIEREMRGFSTLDEDEEKNSGGQSEVL